jgi:hypothetical protein
MSRVNTGNMRALRTFAMEWKQKLNVDVLFAVPKRFPDKLDIWPGAVVWRVERDDVGREGLQERA